MTTSHDVMINFRPVLDVKTKKLEFVRGALDRKIDLVNQKRAYWARKN